MFSPKDVKFITSIIPQDNIFKWIRTGEFANLETYRQTWSIHDNILFIESLLLQVPQQPFYFFQLPDNSFSIIDGAQRLKALKSFVVDGTLQLNNLEYLGKYDECYYKELPIVLRRVIDEIVITVHVVEKLTDDQMVINLCKRINPKNLQYIVK